MTTSNQPLLDVDGLHINFGKRAVVRDVSLTIGRNETVALVGESGSGKSLTALSILKLLPKGASVSAGVTTFDGINLTAADDETLRHVRGGRVAVIFQEPMTSLNAVHTIQRQIVEMIRQHQKVSKHEARARTLELLEKVGIQNARERLKAYPHELSGGQRQRVMIAMALACNPDLIIADEPTTALDVTVQAQILQLLRDLQKDYGMGLLLITHDLGVVRHMADRVYVMQHGEIVEHGASARVFGAPEHPYTRKLLGAEPKGLATPADESAPVVLDAQDVQVHFPLGSAWFGKKKILKAVDGVSLTIRAGSTVGVVGESGSGKTTLAHALLRLLPKQLCKGQVSVVGQDLFSLNTKDLRALRADVQMVFQDPFGSLSPRMSVGQIVAEGLSVHQPNLSESEVDEKVCAVLADVGLDPEARHRYPHEFSGGQRQRISIARALILQPKFMVLDEPTSALDMTVQAQIVDLLRDLQQKYGLAYLFISHDLKVVRAMCNHVVVMKDGQVVEQGASEDIFNDPKQLYTKALLAAALDNKVVHQQAVAS